MVYGMPGTQYVRCTNPRCGKLNPVQAEEAGEGKEYTCVFCGHPFTLPKSTQPEEASFKKRSRGKKRLAPSEARPENRNTRKPNI